LYADKPKWLTPPLLKVLALDLMCASFDRMSACFPEGYPPALVRVMLLALGLPPDHEVGLWDRKRLHRRGEPDRAARDAALKIDWWWYENVGVLLGHRTLAGILNRRGFKTSWSTVRTWRKKSYEVTPGALDYLRPDIPTTQDIEERSR
jgi:hypothetical protein